MHYSKFDESEYHGETDARVAARTARHDEAREEEQRVERAAFLAREEAECFFVDAMNQEEYTVFLALEESAQAAIMAATLREAA